MRVLSTMLAVGIAPLLIAAPAPGQGQALAAPEPAAEVSELDKVVCKKFPPPVGTRLRARTICHTTSEWKQIRRDEREAVEDLQRRNGHVRPGN